MIAVWRSIGVPVVIGLPEGYTEADLAEAARTDVEVEYVNRRAGAQSPNSDNA